MLKQFDISTVNFLKTIKIGKEPVVILPLKKWKEFEMMIQDWQDTERFNKAIADKKNQTRFSFRDVKKKLKLS